MVIRLAQKTKLVGKRVVTVVVSSSPSSQVLVGIVDVEADEHVVTL